MIRIMGALGAGVLLILCARLSPIPTALCKGAWHLGIDAPHNSGPPELGEKQR